MNQRMIISTILPLFFTGLSYSQHMIWPTDASRLMTSSFGEYREGHLHAGIDIKTWGKEGYRIFAIDRGSVIKIRVSPYGYGKAIYLCLDGGTTVVYGHLSRFSESLEQLIRTEQNKQGKFSLELTFNHNEIKVKQGECLGYTGSTGIGDPHLHFEVRDQENRPFNPLFLGYSLDDHTVPRILAMAVSPLDFQSHVEGDFKPQVFSAHQINEIEYRLDTVISCWGQLGISISSFDQGGGVQNRFGIYKKTLIIDDQTVITVRYDRFPYIMTHQVNLDREYRLHSWGEGLYEKLFCEFENTLPFYETDTIHVGAIQGNEKNSLKSESRAAESLQNGAIYLNQGEHDFFIQVSDYFGNMSSLSGKLKVIPLIPFYRNRDRVPVFKINDIEMLNPEDPIILKKEIYPQYIRFVFQYAVPLAEEPTLWIHYGLYNTVPVSLLLKSPGRFVGKLQLDSKVRDQICSELYWRPLDEKERVVRDTMFLTPINPKQENRLSSMDGIFQAVFPYGALYQPLWISINSFPTATSCNPFGKEFSILPQEIPLRGKIQVRFDVSSLKINRDKLAIYERKQDGQYQYVGHGSDPNQNNLFAWAERLGRYAVLMDTIPPSIQSIYPSPESILMDQTPRFVVYFQDTLSDIYGEQNYRIRVDGNPLIVEYDPEENLGFCQIEDPLKPGKHIIEVEISDRMGNRSEKRSRFTIK